MHQLPYGKMLIRQAQVSATNLRMGNVDPLDTPQQLLEHVLATAASGVEHGGEETDEKSVSTAVTNFVIGQLKLLQHDYVLVDEVRVLLNECVERSEKAKEVMHTMPVGTSNSLMAWEVMRGRVEGALEGIQHESETDNRLNGQHGSIAMIRSILDTICISPTSVAEWHPITESAVAGESGTGPSAAEVTQDIQMLDLIRHMAKAYQDSLIQCDELVRRILQNVGTYTNNESAETGKWLLEQLSGMNNSPLTLSPLGRSRNAMRQPARERLKKLIEIVSKDVFSGSGELSKQPNVYALWGKSSVGVLETKDQPHAQGVQCSGAWCVRI